MINVQFVDMKTSGILTISARSAAGNEIRSKKICLMRLAM